MYQLKPLKQYMYYRNQKIDETNYKNDTDKVFSITLTSLTSNEHYLDPMKNFVFRSIQKCMSFKMLCYCRIHQSYHPTADFYNRCTVSMV